VIYFHPVAGYGIDYVPRLVEISQPLPPRSRGVNCGMYDSRGVFEVHLRDPPRILPLHRGRYVYLIAMIPRDMHPQESAYVSITRPLTRSRSFALNYRDNRDVARYVAVIVS